MTEKLRVSREFCDFLSLPDVDDSCEQTDEDEKEECRSDAAAICEALKKVQNYCDEQQNGCRECAFYLSWYEDCKFGSCPREWDIDGICDSVEEISASEKRGVINHDNIVRLQSRGV